MIPHFVLANPQYMALPSCPWYLDKLVVGVALAIQFYTFYILWRE